MGSTGEVHWVFESTGNVETDFEGASVKVMLFPPFPLQCL